MMARTTTRSAVDEVAEAAVLVACFSEDEAWTLPRLARDLDLSQLETLRLIAASEVMPMIGLDCAEGSEQEAEFFGLALAGVPLRMSLQWCSAIDVQDVRPTVEQLRSAMTGPDLRPGFLVASELGLPFTCDGHLAAVEHLGRQHIRDVRMAVDELRRHNRLVTVDHVVAALRGLVAPHDAWAPQGLGEDLDDRAFCSPVEAARRAAIPCAYARGSKPATASGRAGGKAKSGRKSGKGRRWGKHRGTGRSAAYPVGAPVADRRTAAEKAWENRTHW